MGTHPIFESDFDCLTDTVMSGPSQNDSAAIQHSELLHMSYREPFLAAQLNANNVLDYFSNIANPFYDRQCNNEQLRMQGRPLDSLVNMPGIEYTLHHYQEPVLYIIQKRRRVITDSGQQLEPLAYYHIICGTVYMAPDLASVLNSRLATALDRVHGAFKKCQRASNFDPDKGYSWNWGDGDKTKEEQAKEKEEEVQRQLQKIATPFQKNRVDILLGKMQRSHPHIFFQSSPNKEPIELHHPLKAEPKATPRPTVRKIKNEADLGPAAKRARTQ